MPSTARLNIAAVFLLLQIHRTLNVIITRTCGRLRFVHNAPSFLVRSNQRSSRTIVTETNRPFDTMSEEGIIGIRNKMLHFMSYCEVYWAGKIGGPKECPI